MNKPLSAFAARKAIRTRPAPKTAFTEAHALAADDKDSNADNVPPPQKRRKRATNAGPYSAAITQNDRGRGKIATSRHISALRSSSDGSISDGGGETDSDLEASDVANGQDAAIEGDDSNAESLSSKAFSIKKLSSFRPCQSNVLSESNTKWTVRMDRKDTLALVGEYDLWIKKGGAVSIYGAVLYASSRMHRVYAPSTHALPLIRPMRNPFGPEDQPVEITITSCGSRIRTLKQIAPRFGRIWNGKPSSDERNISSIDFTKRSFLSMHSSADDSYQRPLESLDPPADWQTMIMQLLSRNSARSPAAVLVCGPKGSGKSTFCRMLGNSLLTKPTNEAQPDSVSLRQDSIAFLDLDPGQPEFSPPGDISLCELRLCNFGAPFTHPTVPPGNGSRLIRSHHVGNLSPKEDPYYYLTCAYDLFDAYNSLSRSYPSCPIVINCPGWIQGSGLELLVDLIKAFHPTNVVYLSLSGPEEVVDALSKASSITNTQFHQTSTQPSQAVVRTASELRMMQMLSYFHLDEPEIGNLRWTSSPLIQRAPLVTHYAGPKQAIFAVMIIGEEQKPEVFESILEGCVVGMIVIEDDSVIPLAAAPITRKESEEVTDEGLYTGAGEGSHAEVNDLRPNEIPEGSDQHVSSKSSNAIDVHSGPGRGAPMHLYHPAIQRTPIGIPYIPPTNHITTPLSPSHSHCLGQALVRSIDPDSKTIHLLTPIPPSTLQSLHQEKRKIVLVRGKLDTPTWAYKEQLELEKTKRRRREKELGVQEELDEEAMGEWARKTPWAALVEGGRRGSAKARRVRRDIKYRGQGRGEVSE